ncbi:DUF6274 family protein [Streptomyces sp. NPDC014623]|uniref:DUF6274 family protein n=1 Tax=Streptomyces sp. NPDC014623 TaxID=3364875 RepID=UPI0036FAF06F
MSAPTERHETRALLRAHLAAASGYRHLTRHCPVCHRLLRLAMEPLTGPQAPHALQEPGGAIRQPPAPESRTGGPGRIAGATPPLRAGADGDESGRKGAGGNGADRRPERPRNLFEDRSGDESPPAA